MQEVTFFGWLIAATVHLYRKQAGKDKATRNKKTKSKCGGCRR